MKHKTSHLIVKQIQHRLILPNYLIQKYSFLKPTSSIFYDSSFLVTNLNPSSRFLHPQNMEYILNSDDNYLLPRLCLYSIQEKMELFHKTQQQIESDLQNITFIWKHKDDSTIGYSLDLITSTKRFNYLY